MVITRLVSSLRLSRASHAASSGSIPSLLGRKAVSTALLCLTGGVALSAIDDLAVYHACSSKAMEKASKNQAITSAIGEPVEKGPWYNASLGIVRKRGSVSCSFPLSGLQGNDILHLKAVRNGEDSWLSFFRPREFEILIMDALLHVPSNNEKQQTIKVNLSGDFPPSPPCTNAPDLKNQETWISSEHHHGFGSLLFYQDELIPKIQQKF